MNLGPLVALLAADLTQAQTLIPVLAGLAFLIVGGVIMLGNHARGKEAGVCAIIGAAIMVAAPQISAGFHP